LMDIQFLASSAGHFSSRCPILVTGGIKWFHVVVF
jgi:hypothetical protein